MGVLSGCAISWLPRIATRIAEWVAIWVCYLLATADSYPDSRMDSYLVVLSLGYRG